MPLIYGEGNEKALKRLKEEIDKASKVNSFLFLLAFVKSKGVSIY